VPQALLIDVQNDDFPGGAYTLAGIEAVKAPPD
jgi:hypothetical protein